ncbi:hypothetical protein RCC89_02070 [Cytophagaceae bacterium ABcell3]|nr:hypothetical protein RCC89_02070 [Cytophagaceae bacterium ABcell3]
MISSSDKLHAQQGAASAGLELIENAQEIAANSQEWIQKINEAADNVQSNNLYQTLVDGHSQEFPFGILPVGDGDENHALIVNSVSLDAAQGMTAEIFMRIPFRSGEELFFVADKVPLSRRGKLSGDFTLMLLNSITISVGSGYKLKFRGLDSLNTGFDSTYVTFDCKGFKEVTLNGSLSLDPDAVTKYDENNTNEPLDLKFYVTANRMSDFIVNLRDIPDVQFKSLPGFRCSIPSITLDQSEVKNAPKFSLPSWYLDSLETVNGASFDREDFGSVRWTGLYIDSIEIEIPRSLTEGSDKKNIGIVCRDLIVDQHGISGLTHAENVLQANSKGFKYSMDTIRVNIIANGLSHGSFKGKMSFPICDEESTVDYGLMMTRDLSSNELSYHGSAEFSGNLNAQAFGVARMNLTGVELDFKYRNKQFFPEASLDGTLTVSPTSNTDGDGDAVGTFGLEFNKLKVSSSAPYLGLDDEDSSSYVRAISNQSSSQLANLPISINDFNFKTSNGGQRKGLGLELDIKLQNSAGNDNSSGNGFGGSTSFTIWTKRNASTQRWQYDNFDLNAVNLSVQNGSYSLTGSLEMFDGDEQYGKGFCGSVELSLVEMFELNASMIFGRVTSETGTESVEVHTVDTDNNFETSSSEEERAVSTGETLYRYWFADGSISFSPALTVSPGLDINAFTGGFYYNMEMARPGNEPETSLECKSSSGRVFTPNNSYFGVLAGIGIQSTGGGTAFNGEINFSIEFNRGGGINRIATYGGVGMLAKDFTPPGVSEIASTMGMDPVSDTTKNQTSSFLNSISGNVKAGWYVEYDFPNRTLNGDFDIYVNVGNALKGLHNGIAGRIAIHSSPGTWYVYIGKPIEPIGLEVLGLATAQSYFCIGTQLPDPPIAPLPAELGQGEDFSTNPLLAVGGGLSFGSRMSLGGNPGLDLGICGLRLEVSYSVGAGFDLMLTKTAEPVYCGNFTTGDGRGVNNWYATGQVFLYGAAGLNVAWSKCGGGSREIMSMWLNAFVFAQLPRPTYVKGKVDYGFRILGRGFDGSVSLEIGDRCDVPILDSEVDFIETITPVNSQQDVPVGENIIVTFSSPLRNTVYGIRNSRGDYEFFRPVLDNVEISSSSGEILYETEMNSGMDQLNITPLRVYPGNSEITVTVQLRIQKEASENEWINTENTQSKSVTFKTEEDAGRIDVSDIFYAYPLPGMKNFYKDESSQGYIRLSVLPGKAVELAEGYTFNVAVFDGNDEKDRQRNVTYNDNYGQHNFTFNIPNVALENGKEYTLKVMKSPIPTHTSQGVSQDGNVTSGVVAEETPDSVVLEYKFTTSKYSTFSGKMSLYSTSFSEVFDGVMAANLSINSISGLDSHEPLSSEETNGYISNGVLRSSALIRFGSLEYDNPSLNSIIENIREPVNNIEATQDGISAVTDLIGAVNEGLETMNLDCLLSGGCSSTDMQSVEIPAGNFTLPIGYYLPGKSTPASTYNLVVNLNEALSLPR